MAVPVPRPFRSNLPAKTKGHPPASPPPPGPEPASEPTYDVLSLINDVESGWNQLRSNAAAFGAMNRAADGGSPQDGSPILSWTANFNGKPVEVQTDLGEIDAAALPGIYDAIINHHGGQMLASVAKILVAAGRLKQALERSVQQVAPVDADADEDEDEGPVAT